MMSVQGKTSENFPTKKPGRDHSALSSISQGTKLAPYIKIFIYKNSSYYYVLRKKTTFVSNIPDYY